MSTTYSGLRDECGAHYGRYVGVREAVYPPAARDASAGARHPPRVTRFASWCVQRSKLDSVEGETNTRSRMRPRLHAVSLGGPTGTASKDRFLH